MNRSEKPTIASAGTITSHGRSPKKRFTLDSSAFQASQSRAAAALLFFLTIERFLSHGLTIARGLEPSPMGTPALFIGFTAFVLFMLAIDLGVFHRKQHVVSTREAIA